MILASFPIYNVPDVTERAIESLGDVDTFFVVNSPELKQLVEHKNYVVNGVNNYCNGAWNQAMAYFLQGDWDYLALGSSDVIMGNNWFNLIPDKSHKWICVPTYADSLERLGNQRGEFKELKGGVAGAFTVLPREAVEIIYPIPRGMKLWFGDEYMYSKLRSLGWKVMQAEFTAYHYGSLSIPANLESGNIIEGDKIAWQKYCTSHSQSPAQSNSDR